MRCFHRATLAAVAAVGFASVASAADMAAPVPMYTKAPVAIPYSWTGLYVGGNIGYSWGKGDSNYNEPAFAGHGPLPTSFSQSQNLDGVIGGGQIGYNWQANNTWVFGVEADFQGSGEKGSSSITDPYIIDDPILPTITVTNNADIQWFGTVRGRAGVLVTPTMLLYGTGGLAYGRISVSGSVYDSFPPSPYAWSFGQSTTKVGWTVGAGVEGAIPNTRDWTWKLEYLYIDFGTVSGTGFDIDFGGPYSWSTRVTDNILRVGLNYRFH
jgi:outer membrane immunogenic protein